jgi:hypothetical protein
MYCIFTSPSVEDIVQALYVSAEDRPSKMADAITLLTCVQEILVRITAKH